MAKSLINASLIAKMQQISLYELCTMELPFEVRCEHGILFDITWLLHACWIHVMLVFMWHAVTVMAACMVYTYACDMSAKGDMYVTIMVSHLVHVTQMLHACKIINPKWKVKFTQLFIYTILMICSREVAFGECINHMYVIIVMEWYTY